MTACGIAPSMPDEPRHPEEPQLRDTIAINDTIIEPIDTIVPYEDEDYGTLVLVTDSTEWRVKIFKEHLLYSDAVAVKLPAPWSIPTREEASILRTLTYGSGSERFVTSDGYTFGMPSSSVSKAGAKTKYSVLGLYIRKTVIEVKF